MARFRKTVLVPGDYYVARTDEPGFVRFGDAYLRRVADTHQQMRAAGLKTPLCWGHQPESNPFDDADREYRSSAYNAGYLDRLTYDGRELVAEGEAPGCDVDEHGNLLAWVKLDDGRQVRTAIGECSIGINSFTDGKGRKWEDAPIHLAMVVRPVVHGTSGFMALSTKPAGHKAAITCPPGQTAVCTARGCECRPIPARAFARSAPGKALCLSLFMLATERAPAGGISIAGKFFRGGQFIPSSTLANASPAEKKQLADTKEEHRGKLKAAVGEAGPDHGALRSKLEPHAGTELKAHQLSEARRTFAGIKSYHGDLAAHRLHQLIHADSAALEKATGPTAERLKLRLASYRHMLDWQADGEKKAADAERAKRTGVHNVAIADLHVDPERFQYKLGTKGVSGEVTEGSALEGVKKFNKSFAGVILVWHDPKDGKDYVVNGHHRYGLARRAGEKSMNVLYIPHEDAPDAKTARKVGALANIAEGRGTSVDAAKLIRDEGFTPEDFAAEGVSLKGKQAADAFVLGNLSDGLFRKLTLGQLDQKQALAIGGIKSHDAQQQFANYLEKETEKRGEIPDKILARMAQKIQNTKSVTTSTQSLFGTDEQEENLFLHRATLETHILAKLSQEANLFGAVSTDKKAEMLKRGDNVISAGANKQIADEAKSHRAVVGKLVDSKGAIADAFAAAAEELFHAPKRRKEIEAGLLERVRGLVQAELGQGDAGDAGAAPAASPGPSPAPARAVPAEDGIPAGGPSRRSESVMPSAARRTRAEYDVGGEGTPEQKEEISRVAHAVLGKYGVRLKSLQVKDDDMKDLAWRAGATHSAGHVNIGRNYLTMKPRTADEAARHQQHSAMVVAQGKQRIAELQKKADGARGAEKKKLLKQVREQERELANNLAPVDYVQNNAKSPLTAAVAHEAGHALESELGVDFPKAIREARDAGALRDEHYHGLSMYGSSHPAEMFAEITAAIHSGQEDAIPKPLRDAYEKAIAEALGRRSKGAAA